MGAKIRVINLLNKLIIVNHKVTCLTEIQNPNPAEYNPGAVRKVLLEPLRRLLKKSKSSNPRYFDRDRLRGRKENMQIPIAIGTQRSN